MLLPPAGGVGAASVQLVPAAHQVGQQGRVLLRHLPSPLSECTPYSLIVKNSHNQHYRTTERASCSPARPIWPGGSASPPALTRLLVPNTMYNVRAFSCPVQCTSEYYCTQYNMRRNILSEYIPTHIHICTNTQLFTHCITHLSPATPSPHSRAQ